MANDKNSQPKAAKPVPPTPAEALSSAHQVEEQIGMQRHPALVFAQGGLAFPSARKGERPVSPNRNQREQKKSERGELHGFPRSHRIGVGQINRQQSRGHDGNLHGGSKPGQDAEGH